jgi:hypothetical protein
MANTNILYNAAYSGAIAGVSSRWLTSAAQTTFPTVIAACEAFATALDNELGEVEDASQADANLLQQICSSFWENRQPTGTEVEDYEPYVLPLAVLFDESRVGLEPVSGGGGGAPFIPFVAFGGNTFVVDAIPSESDSFIIYPADQGAFPEGTTHILFQGYVSMTLEGINTVVITPEVTFDGGDTWIGPATGSTYEYANIGAGGGTFLLPIGGIFAIGDATGAIAVEGRVSVSADPNANNPTVNSVVNITAQAVIQPAD